MHFSITQLTRRDGFLEDLYKLHRHLGVTFYLLMLAKGVCTIELKLIRFFFSLLTSPRLTFLFVYEFLVDL